MGIHLPLANAIERAIKDHKPKVRCEPIPLSKVGDYSEQNNSNTTFPIEFNEVQRFAILDSGARVTLIMVQV